MNVSPILAEFVSPWLLWGLAGATAPLLIHLLNKRKFKETQWAAMKFLLEAVRKNSRRIRIEQLILLAVRTMILVLFVLAVAGPYVEQLGNYFQANQPAHKIIVIDASFSMGYQLAESNLFERSRDVARSIVEESRQGDAINVVRISNLPPLAVVETPAFQPAEVVQEIDQLQLPNGRGDIAATLRKIEDLLKAAPTLTRKEVYFISDFQRATWSADSVDEVGQLRSAIKRLGDKSRVTLIDVGQAGAENLAVTEFAALEPFVTIATPVQFRATVRNFGLARAANQALELYVDGKLAEQHRIDLNGGADVTEIFTHAFVLGGEHRVEMRLQKDALAIDDQRWLSVPVKERIKVLCVNGKSSGRAMGKATDYLELALSPLSAGGLTSGLIEPHVVNEGELQGLDLNQYDCVFLCNVALFTAREAEILESYLKGGGGVVWCLGDRVQADSYNQVLYRDGKGILPARLGDRKGDPVARKESFQFRAGDFNHAIVNAFRGNPDAGLETTQTYAYINASLAPKSTSRVALQFDSGDPAIVDSPVGLGHSVLITTSVDDRWGNWPLWPSFVPLIQETVRYAVSGRWGERQQIVGMPLVQTLPTGAVDVEVSVTRPDAQTIPVPTSQVSQLTQFTYNATDYSGIYDVNLGAPLSRTELFAVNVDPRESDLAKLSQEDLKDELFNGVEFDYNTQWQDHATRRESPITERGGPLTRWLLYATLYLMFVEQAMAWRFQLGLCLLCPPYAAVVLAKRGRAG